MTVFLHLFLLLSLPIASIFPARSCDHPCKDQASILTISLSIYSNRFKIISYTPSIEGQNKSFPKVPKQASPFLAYYYIEEEF